MGVPPGAPACVDRDAIASSCVAGDASVASGANAPLDTLGGVGEDATSDSSSSGALGGVTGDVAEFIGEVALFDVPSWT